MTSFYDYKYILLFETITPNQMELDPDVFLAANPSIFDADHELEMEYNEKLLLAAGNSASNKRNSSKK